MPLPAPKIDDRRLQDLVAEAKRLAKIYCPEWEAPVAGDPGLALIYLFARMMETIIERLNKVPEKSFLAFLDLFRVQLRPPQPARVPVTFQLVDGAPDDVLVVKGTQVATKKSGETLAVVFETEEDLTVVRPKLVSCITLNPQQDRFRNHSAVVKGEEQGPFNVFDGEELIPHILYLGHSIFGLEVPKDITISFTLAESASDFPEKWQLEWRFWDGVSWRSLDPENDTSAGLTKTGDVILKDVTGVERTKIAGLESHWIACQPIRPIRLDLEKLPKITNVEIKVIINKRQAGIEHAFFNNQPIDMSKDFYPFGETPRFNDTFYLGSQEGFSKVDAEITIQVWISDGFTPGPSDDLELTWEYWTGDEWANLELNSGIGYKFSASTEPGLGEEDEEEISFTCPGDIAKRAVGGEENFWIRVRITAGNYGEDMRYMSEEEARSQGIKNYIVVGRDPQENPWVFVPESFRPPSVKSVRVTYEYEGAKQALEKCITYNNFCYKSQQVENSPQSKAFCPFERPKQKHPSIYLGFDQGFSDVEVSIYLGVVCRLFVPASHGNAEKVRPRVDWYYWNGEPWMGLAAQDGTDCFTQAGFLKFLGPVDFCETTLFGKRRFWVRAELGEGDYEELKGNGYLPELAGLHLNTISALHSLTTQNEILGSSNGYPKQVFALSKAPVLPGQKILVKEAGVPSEVDQSTIVEDEGEDAIEAILDESGKAVGAWVRWHEVPDFRLSGAESRHYVIERAKGEVRFGDGQKGMIPPPGTDNVKCQTYRCGGGREGNQPVGSVSTLVSSIPYIGGVTNPAAADGGADQEDLHTVKERGPQTLRHRYRAVTPEDYEWLAREASALLARSKCLSAMGGLSAGKIGVVIVPDSSAKKPFPSPQLIRYVEDYLNEHSLASVTDMSGITVLGPGYVEVGVTARVVPISRQQAKLVEDRIVRHLTDFFHPLTGGPEGKGWAFGRDVFISEVYQAIEKVQGVDHVEEAYMNATAQVLRLNVESSLPYVPEHASVWTQDGNVRMRILNWERTHAANCIDVRGFQEGDWIVVKNGHARCFLYLRSVSGDTLHVVPSQVLLEFPKESQVCSLDGLTVTTLAKPLPKHADRATVRIFETEDGISITSRIAPPTHGVYAMVAPVSDRLKRVYLDDLYLPCSGVHTINMTST